MFAEASILEGEIINIDMTTAYNSVKVELLIEHNHLINAVGDLRWREWGYPPEPTERDWWIAATSYEAGRDHLPVTWVAINETGEAIGAVGLGEYDIVERRDRSPWILGMIVRPDCQRRGVGRLLLAQLEVWAKSRGFKQLWVANEGPAINFYQKCGWKLIETVERISGGSVFILTKSL